MKIGTTQTFPQWVKIIYNPPYNTGNDFIYADDFMRSQDEENRQMGMYDEDENRLSAITQKEMRNLKRVAATELIH